MKALSIKQPWAWLICAGYKDIENRDWRIGRKPVPGMSSVNFSVSLPIRIYVHAGKSFDEDGFFWVTEDNRFRSVKNFPAAFKYLMAEDWDNYPRGAIVGEVDIVDCVSKSDSPWFVGKYGFVLQNPQLYEKPIPYRGQLGFFNVELPK